MWAAAAAVLDRSGREGGKEGEVGRGAGAGAEVEAVLVPAATCGGGDGEEDEVEEEYGQRKTLV
jgi:hypothetical protein